METTGSNNYHGHTVTARKMNRGLSLLGQEFARLSASPSAHQNQRFKLTVKKLQMDVCPIDVQHALDFETSFSRDLVCIPHLQLRIHFNRDADDHLW